MVLMVINGNFEGAMLWLGELGKMWKYEISLCFEHFSSLMSLMSGSRFEWVSQVSKAVAYEDNIAMRCHEI